jgi:hypothetical protein
MDNKRVDSYNEIYDKFKSIKKELFEEWKNKYPSYYVLENSSIEIIEILKNATIHDEDFKVWSSWRIRNLDIFNVDLVGELNHKEWNKERKKIDDIISEFKMKFIDEVK